MRKSSKPTGSVQLRRRQWSRMRRREAGYGLLFLTPFILGVIFLLAVPLAQSFMMSLGDIDTQNGYDIVVRGLANYHEALRVDADYIEYLLSALRSTAFDTPLIVIVSFVVAMLLVREFPGRAIYRAIFFLPVILTAGVMPQIKVDDLILSTIDPAQSFGNAEEALSAGQTFVTDLLLSGELGTRVTGYILYAQQNIATVLSHSGIQILILLAALRSISPSLYEASAIEGATAWENFWKITLPMVGPQLVVVVLFTVIDRLVDMSGTVMQYIYSVGFSDMRFGYSSAMAWIYFVIVGSIVAVLYQILRRSTDIYR